MCYVYVESVVGYNIVIFLVLFFCFNLLLVPVFVLVLALPFYVLHIFFLTFIRKGGGAGYLLPKL